MAKENRDQEVSALIIGYEFALGLIETLLGLGIVFFGKAVIAQYQTLRDSEFLNEGHDLLVDLLQKVIPYVSDHRVYVSVLLLALGLVKIASSIGLWMGKKWGKHLMIGLLVVLIPFDVVGILKHPKLLELIYLLIDVLIILFMTGFKPHHYFLEVKRMFK